jgi:cyclic beta-1,2-glucan synthetase
VRGDWQILWWLLPFVPSRSGLQRNRLSILARWKILDNLRRSLLPPASLALLLLGWTVLPGNPAVWTIASFASLAFAMVSPFVQVLTGPRRNVSWFVFLRVVIDDLKTAAARSGIQTAFMAYEAYERLHAIIITLVRLGITQHRLLEWETAAASTARGGPPRLRAFISGMIASPSLALATFVLVALVRPRTLSIAFPIPRCGLSRR